MFSFTFALISLLILGVSSQTNTFDTLPLNSVEKASLFGQFQRIVDNQNRVLSSSDLTQLNQNQPISCNRVRPNIKNAHPTDNTKYVICRDETRYEILTCPNGGVFNNTEKACIDLCEQNKPCLNQGQCIILPNLTLECVCRRDWTGERCEIPLSTCANNPCGQNNECRMLKTHEYSQDYVCICNNQQSYGRNCQQTVPNPCLGHRQQFHPFAFSRRAYINCDDEVIFFQPCNSLLYWNQEGKRCDRSLPDLLRSPFVFLKSQNTQKQEVQSNLVKSTQWENSAVMQRQPPTSQFEQWQQNNQQQLGLNTMSDSNNGQLQRMRENQQQKPNLPPLSQGLSTQQWSNQIPDIQTQTNQRFATQSQPWQDQNQQSLTNTFMETITSVPRIFRLQGFSDRNSGEQQSQWPANSQFMNNQQPPQGRNQQTFTTSQIQSPFQQNIQFGLGQQSRTDQLPLSSLGTTATANNGVQEGLIINTLHGWKSNQQEPLNQMDEKDTRDSIPTFQLKSWKA